jgi:hypothetical protein
VGDSEIGCFRDAVSVPESLSWGVRPLDHWWR